MGVRRKNHFAESAASTAADTTVEMLALTLALAGDRARAITWPMPATVEHGPAKWKTAGRTRGHSLASPTAGTGSSFPGVRCRVFVSFHARQRRQPKRRPRSLATPRARVRVNRKTRVQRLSCATNGV